jgi:organic radical activating enzyme
VEPKKKFWLFKQSKHFCSVPWNHFEILSSGIVRTCSKGQALGNINTDDLENILASDQLRQIKQDLLEDRLNNNCVGCHRLTTGNEHFDLRNHYNPMFKDSDVDYEDLSAFQLNGIDLHWDNTCNFKCVYCNPYQSSLIAQEQGMPVVRNENANVDKIIKLVVDNQYHMKEIYLSGGEPLLIKNNARLLSSITNTDLPIRINSNLSMASESNAVFKELTRFKNVLWTISADSRGERFNYNRNGGDWNKFLNNVDTVTQLGHQLRINLVWFVGSIADIFDTIEFFVKKYKITDITINQLHDHAYLLARNAPKDVKEAARERLYKLLNSGLIEEQSNSWYNITRCERELDTDLEDPDSYKEYFDQLDQQRGTIWRKVFPELV